MQQQNVFSYSFSNAEANRQTKTKPGRKPQRRKKTIDYIDSIYLPKIESKKAS